MQLEEWLMDIALQYQLLGVFIISFIGTAAVFFPVPYTAVIFYLGLKGWNPVLLAAAGAFGSTAGEFTGYLVGYCGRKFINAENKRGMEFFTEIFRKYGAIAIFIFALTPLPDDVIFIPLGTLKYPVLETLTSCFAGKFLMCLILAYFGGIYGSALEKFFGEGGSWITALITIIALIVAYYFLMKIDWQAFIERYAKRFEKVNEK